MPRGSLVPGKRPPQTCLAVEVLFPLVSAAGWIAPFARAPLKCISYCTPAKELPSLNESNRSSNSKMTAWRFCVFAVALKSATSVSRSPHFLSTTASSGWPHCDLRQARRKLQTSPICGVKEGSAGAFSRPRGGGRRVVTCHGTGCRFRRTCRRLPWQVSPCPPPRREKRPPRSLPSPRKWVRFCSFRRAWRRSAMWPA